MNNYWDKFLNDVLYPLLSFFALLVFLCNAPAARAADFEVSLFPEVEHMSHAGQHAPFTSSPTAYGANLIGIGIDLVYKRLNVQLVESYNLSPCYQVYGHEEHGEIMGGRENFSLRVQYRFVIWSR